MERPFVLMRFHVVRQKIEFFADISREPKNNNKNANFGGRFFSPTKSLTKKIGWSLMRKQVRWYDNELVQVGGVVKQKNKLL